MKSAVLESSTTLGVIATRIFSSRGAPRIAEAMSGEEKTRPPMMTGRTGTDAAFPIFIFTPPPPMKRARSDTCPAPMIVRSLLTRVSIQVAITTRLTFAAMGG